MRISGRAVIRIKSDNTTAISYIKYINNMEKIIPNSCIIYQKQYDGILYK